MFNERMKAIKNVTIFSFVVNVFLTIGKLIFGILGNSTAVIADSIHSLTDLVTDVIVLIGVKISCRPADENHNYGHGKIEPLSTIFISFALVFAVYSIFRSGVESLIAYFGGSGGTQTPTLWALLILVISIISKEVVFQFSIRVGKKYDSDAMIANAWHHRSDSLSSVAALIGVSLSYFFGGIFVIADPVAAIIVAIFVFKVAIEILLPNLNQLLETSLSVDQIERIREIIAEEEQVLEFHKLKTRKIGNYYAVDLHILVDADLNIIDAHNISTHIENKLLNDFCDKMFINIHIEPFLDETRIVK